MKKMSPVKKSIITAVCIALCVVLPQAFHAIPNAGSIYCPMHIPVLLCGIAGPLVSALITGMPPAAVLPGMLVECAAYGALTGLMMQLVHTKKVYPDLYISLLVAMLGGRIISGIAKALIFSAGSYSMTAWVTGSFVTSLPGIIVHLVLIPSIVYALMKAKLIPARY